MNKKRKVLFIFILIILVTIFPLTQSSIANNNIFKNYTLGYGPLEGETGYPVVSDKDSSGKIIILDALKSAIIILDENHKYIKSFSIGNFVPPNITNVILKVSNDGFICLLINNTIIQFNFDGVLTKTYSLQDNKYLIGKSIQFFVPLSNDKFVLKDEFSGEVFIFSFKEDREPIKLKNGESNLIDVLDIAVFKDTICILHNNSSIGKPSDFLLSLYSSSGLLTKEVYLSDYSSIDYPSNCSFDITGNIFILGTNFNCIIFSIDLILINKITTNNLNSQDFTKSFTAYKNNSFLLCNPSKGIVVVMNNEELKIISPVVKKENKLFAPSSVCGNKENLFIYDSLTHLINFFQFDIFKKSFSTFDFFSSGDFHSKVSLFQSSSSSFFVVIQGIETRIKKIDPSSGTIKDIKIPSYISPRSSVYIRSKDNQIYFYSWFDSILYVFQENSEVPNKVQINKVESSMFSSDSICKIDNNDNIFILLPNLKKINVFNTSGSLVTSFPLQSEGFSYFTTFDFYEDLLVVLNQYQSIMDFYSKRGEKLFSTGNKGVILYPKYEKGYTENPDLFSFPTSLSCFQSTIALADTGNSRIIILENKVNQEKIIIELQIGSKSAYINKLRVDLDAPPFTENGRTLVPFRFIGEALGAKIEWNQSLKKAIYELSGIKVEITIGSSIAKVNGNEVKMDVPPKISNGRTFVPIRFVVEALGASVIWEASTKKIIITYPGG